MEEKKKQLTLDDLYVLRAGLSFISQQKDDITKIEDKALNEHAKIAQNFAAGREVAVYRNECSYNHFVENWISEQKSFTDDFKNGMQTLGGIAKNADIYCHDIETPDFGDDEDAEDEFYDQLNKKIRLRAESVYGAWLGSDESIDYFNFKINNQKRMNSRKSPAHYFFSGLLAIIFTVIFAVGACISVYMFFKLWSDHMWQPIVCAVSLALCILFIVLCIRRIRKSFDSYGFSKRKNFNAKDDIAKIKEVVGLLPQLKQKNAEIENRKKSGLNAAKAKSTAMYNSIKEQYKGLLDERDWKYLDLIIYYFETGRADTVKEALQLVEREIQTRRIINVVEQSARYIVGAIERAVEQITSQLSVISNQLNTVIQLQQVQIGQTQRLISKTEMQNALIAKSNQTSETLMKDVAYIKNYKL